MGKAYFISDVHLGLESPERERAKENRLVAFLGEVERDGSELFIVGDLFDAWFEYRTVIPKGFHRVLTKLEDLTRGGITVHYLAGNHDYWMREFFSETLGMKIHREAFESRVQGRRVLLHHGDGLAEKDGGYRLLRTVLRNPLAVWLYSWLHPDIGVALARSSSEKSRGYTAVKDYGERDGMARFAEEKLREGYDIVVMGHRHKPSRVVLGSGVYINLGDWITFNTYAVMERGQIALQEWT
jgi:UDP-2,3-diacylglucosamine hydrolase